MCVGGAYRVFIAYKQGGTKLWSPRPNREVIRLPEPGPRGGGCRDTCGIEVSHQDDALALESGCQGRHGAQDRLLALAVTCRELIQVDDQHNLAPHQFRLQGKESTISGWGQLTPGSSVDTLCAGRRPFSCGRRKCAQVEGCQDTKWIVSVSVHLCP